MQKWEYLKLYIYYIGGDVENVYSNKEEIYNRRRDKGMKFSVSDYLAKLGGEGWELATSTDTGSNTNHYFKRPIE